MKLYAPTYYKDFKCIAGACRHTCCAGWQICIDDETLEKYKKEPFINEQIIYDGGDAQFRLDRAERCAFLNENNLCELILRYGEGSLCQICRDHPRFRNFWSDGVEIGLGLVCEEAARIILSRKEKMQIEVIDGQDETADLPDDEAFLIDYREKMLASVQDKNEPEPIKRLREYLIYRHIPNALYDDRLDERVAFIDLSVANIYDNWKKTDGSLDNLVEIVVKWSYDVEYDEEKMEKTLENIRRQNK